MKKILCVIISLILCISLASCGGESTTIDFSSDYYDINQIISFDQESGGSFDFVFTQFGKMQEAGTTYTYFDYEVENTGNSSIFFSEADIYCYADSYNVSCGYPFNGGDGSVGTFELSANRKATGRVFFKTDIDAVQTLELEYYDATWLIK